MRSASQPSQAVILLWCALAAPTCLLFGASMVARLARVNTQRPGDFVQEWSSAKNYFLGRPIYAPLKETLPMDLGQARYDAVEINAHPPAAVVLALPFGKSSYGDAWRWWNIFSLAALAASIALIVGERGLSFSPWIWLPVGSLLLASNPLAQQVVEGQLNLVLLLLLTLAWRADRAGRAFLAGALIGLAGAIKVYPLFLGLYFLAARRGRGVGGVFAGFLIANLVAGMVLSWDCFHDYCWQSVPRFTAYQNNLGNSSLAGFWPRLFGPATENMMPCWDAPRLGKGLLLLSRILLIGGLAALGWRAKTLPQRDWAWGACLVGMLLASPITWGHGFVLLTLPCLLFWKLAPENWRARVVLLSLTMLLALVRPGWAADFLKLVEAVFGPNQLGGQATLYLPLQTLTILSWQFYALLGLLAAAFYWFPQESATTCRPFPDCHPPASTLA